MNVNDILQTSISELKDNASHLDDRNKIKKAARWIDTLEEQQKKLRVVVDEIENILQENCSVNDFPIKLGKFKLNNSLTASDQKKIYQTILNSSKSLNSKIENKLTQIEKAFLKRTKKDSKVLDVND